MMRKTYPVTSVLCTVAVLLVGIQCSKARTPATQPAEHVKVAVIDLHGTPDELGQEHGQQLGQEIRLLDAKYLKRFIGGTAKRLLAIGAARAFESHFSPEHLAEVTAMSQAAGLDFDEAALAQCFLDLSATAGCSTITLGAEAAPICCAVWPRS